MVEQSFQAMDVDIPEQPKDLLLSIDTLYNLVVCKHCGVALPSEWVLSHLKEQPEIETTDVQVSEFLGIQDPAMTVAEVEEWRNTAWVGKAVKNVPVVKGYRCNLCQYSVAQ